MKVPIDIIFMDKRKKIIKLYENVSVCQENDTCQTYNSEQASKYAIELPAGTIGKYKIDLNTEIKIY